ncbi:hypothetical protein TorRG33x02_357930, partial [Trema orientale]
MEVDFVLGTPTELSEHEPDLGRKRIEQEKRRAKAEQKK